MRELILLFRKALADWLIGRAIRIAPDDYGLKIALAVAPVIIGDCLNWDDGGADAENG